MFLNQQDMERRGDFLGSVPASKSDSCASTQFEGFVGGYTEDFFCIIDEDEIQNANIYAVS